MSATTSNQHPSKGRQENGKAAVSMAQQHDAFSVTGIRASVSEEGCTASVAAGPIIHIRLGSETGESGEAGMDRVQAVRAISSVVERTRSRSGAIRFGFADAKHADPIFMRQCIYAAAEAGAAHICIAEEKGQTRPEFFAAMVRDTNAFFEGKVTIVAEESAPVATCSCRDASEVKAGDTSSVAVELAAVIDQVAREEAASWTNCA